VDTRGPETSLELVGIEPPEKHARSLAALLTVGRRARVRGNPHLDRLDDHMRVLRGGWGGLSPQLHRLAPWLYEGHGSPPEPRQRVPGRPESPAPVPPLVMRNGFGGFTEDGRQYVVVLDGGQHTSLPWSNVIANPDFGTIVSSSGATFTWSENSRQNCLTPYANDPIVDPTGEAIYLRDEASGATWGATPGPVPRTRDSERWLVRHEAGVTRYQHATRGLEQELAVFVDTDDRWMPWSGVSTRSWGRD
jgi:cyclic beta-1,2-glucan synthetase